MNDFNRILWKKVFFKGISGTTSGFTLIELMVAIAVFVGMSVLAIPSIRGLVDNISGNRAVHEIISDLNVVRSLAVRNGQDASVDIDNARQYTVNWTDANGNAQSKVVDLTGFRHGVQFDDNPPAKGTPATPDPVIQIVFNSQGFATTSGDIYITDQDRSETIRIQVSYAGAICERRWVAAGNQWIYK